MTTKKAPATARTKTRTKARAKTKAIADPYGMTSKKATLKQAQGWRGGGGKRWWRRKGSSGNFF
jgi:hypothetical protein